MSLVLIRNKPRASYKSFIISEISAEKTGATEFLFNCKVIAVAKKCDKSPIQVLQFCGKYRILYA